jgi:hypothetical protein
MICISKFLCEWIAKKIPLDYNEEISYPLYWPRFNEKIYDIYNPYKNLDKPYILYQGRIGLERLGTKSEINRLYQLTKDKFNLVISGSGR